MVTAGLYLRKVPSNHILLESSLVVEYFSTIIAAMDFPTVSDNEFYFCCALAESKCEMFFFGLVLF